MAKRLADKLGEHKATFFRQREDGTHGGGAEWYLHLVIFPSLLEIAERIDAIDERLAKREKKRGGEGSG